MLLNGNPSAANQTVPDGIKIIGERAFAGLGNLYSVKLPYSVVVIGKFAFMHYDEIKAGVSIGVHPHTNHEEVYFLLSGTGTLIFDGKEYDMNAGDVSLCNLGHSHGFIAKTDCVMVVVG